MEDTMPVHDGAATLAGMIPITLDDGDMMGELCAKDWLHDDAADYARVISYGLECHDEADRDAYGMLASDVASMLEACGYVVSRGEAVRVDYPDLHDPRERAALAGYLARICATRPDHSEGPFEAVYDGLARQIVKLLEEPREAA
jgi:hypothetical protein